jgi:methyl coenzyme M reductase subunit D
MDIKAGQTWVTIQDPPQYVEVFEVDTIESSSYQEGYELSVGYFFRGNEYYRSIDSFTKRYTISSGE